MKPRRDYTLAAIILFAGGYEIYDAVRSLSRGVGSAAWNVAYAGVGLVTVTLGVVLAVRALRRTPPPEDV